MNRFNEFNELTPFGENVVYLLRIILVLSFFLGPTIIGITLWVKYHNVVYFLLGMVTNAICGFVASTLP